MAPDGPRLNDLDEMEQRNNPRNKKGSSDWVNMVRKHLLPIAIGGVVIVFILVMLVILSGSGKVEQAAVDWKEPENLEARLNKLEFQHQMVLEKMNKMQQSSSSGVTQNELAKLRKAVSDLEKRLAGLEQRLASQMSAAAGASGDSGKDEGGAEQGVRRHTVQKGETLFRIGQRFGVSVQDLKKWNDIGENDYIQPGQELKVSP